MSIYLDYAATTPVDKRVADKMCSCMTLEGNFGNPASVTHPFGWNAKKAVEEARSQVANLINASASEIVFTSGATEANNLAITGVMQTIFRRSKHFVTVKTEHKAVLDTAKSLERNGFEVTYLTVNQSGLIDLYELQTVLQRQPGLVSVMLVNNETGVIQDIPKIAGMVKQAGALMHVDAVQAVGKIAVDVRALDIDLLSLSAHKIYGPKGIGALYVRQKPRVPITALTHGGGHERGLRSGTLATHQIVGLGEALDIAKNEIKQDFTHSKALRTLFLSKVMVLPKVALNSLDAPCVPNILNMSFDGVDGEALISACDHIAMSLGSACTSATIDPSHVLSAMGLSDAQSHCSLRISFGRFSSETEVSQAADIIVSKVRELRLLSPLWKEE